MWDGFIGKQIKRSNRNLFVTSIILLALPASFGILGLRYWINFFSGPANITAEELINLKGEIPERNYITVEGSKTIKTGVRKTVTTKRRGRITGTRVSARYSLLRVGKKFLIVKAKPDEAKLKAFTGELQPLPQEVRNRIVKPLSRKFPKAESMFLPQMLDQQGDYTFPGYMGLFIGVPCAGFGVWNLLKLKKRKTDPKAHPITKKIIADRDADSVIPAIEQSISAAHTVGKTTITGDWFFQPSLYGMNSVRLEDLVWFYQKVTTRKAYGVVPISKSYATILHDRHGKQYEFAGGEKQVREILEVLYDKAPWAVSGYSDDRQKMWRKNRAELISAVDQRRQAA